ncbi:trimeric LpxA-like domain-containing protein [Tieghemostelium lacteum]|uniref:Trimeric LpxA-like domain-containing protein n=1 Tax=Tieghemostelium lacteum TaxID=361077 RepID=A0A152A9N8_TIELA|nr:trimeric LpxA-like domain-containing protein [Tieghemostelium lacteum]|eukprot:KYR02841.1 trimeric LpxA-like domain-containing protein [Tieghemostelium lacteum]
MYRSLFNYIGEALRSSGQTLDKIGCRLQGNYAYVEKLNRHARVSVFKENIPFLGNSSFIAPNSSVIGNVSIGDKTSIWYNTVLRGDVNTIEIGDETTIGDRTVIHVASKGPKGPMPTTIGNKVYVGPGSILHACTIQDECYIGSGSILYDGSIVEKNGFLESGSLLTSGKKVLSGQVWGGSPAIFIRNVTKNDIENLYQTINDNITLSEEHEIQTQKSSKQLHLDELEISTLNRTSLQNEIHTKKD